MFHKYPRTYNLPSSPGATSDDKVLKDLTCFEGKDIIVTEKMDGECTTMYREHIHARSLDSKDHESRHWVKGLWGRIKHNIPEGWRICGENVYAKHSIHYTNLKSYFYVYSIWDNTNFCLDCKETAQWAGYISPELIPVPVLGISQNCFSKEMIKHYVNNLDLEKQEGFVIRNMGSFHYDDFSTNVAKWVRANHVTTDEHWMSQKIVKNILA